MTDGSPAALSLTEVTYRRDDTVILAPPGVTWSIESGTSWVVLGRNGSGKTTLVRIAALREHPSSGSVTVFGEQLGRVDIRPLRRRIGFASPAMLDLLRPTLTAFQCVVTARHDALEPWWHTYTSADDEAALTAMTEVGVARLAERELRTLSSGERQRILLARVLVNDPGLLLFDEPTAGLDLAGRENLVADFDQLAVRGTPLAMVTHHVEEIPPSFTHCLMIRSGSVLAAGPIEETLNESNLSACFDLPLRLSRREGRFTAWRA